MENFFIDTDDPLFSIIFFIFFILAIVVINYSYELYKQKAQRRSLFSFLQNFEGKKQALDLQNLHYHPSIVKPLSLLAKSFENSGEYEKSIEIYLFLLEHIRDVGQRMIFMELLGKTYLHAGFMAKSRDIFLQVLKQRPRNTEVLNYLLIVYDQLKRYEKAKEMIEPLQILGQDVSHIQNYLDFKIGSDTAAVIKKDKNLVRMGMSKLFREDVAAAWKLYESEMFDDIVDILWYQSRATIDFTVVQQHRELKALYFAKGFIKEECRAKDFNINLLAAAKKSGMHATLTFSYICKSCKSSFPLSFDRCPNCLSINSAKVKVHVSKAQALDSESFS
ncbi:MAG: tetratricopeptide repeat protein [Campylobacterota bacterium]